MATNSQPNYPPWLWGITGLVVGLFIALLLVFSSKEHSADRSPTPLVTSSSDTNLPNAIPAVNKPAVEYKFYTPLPEAETLLGKHRVQQHSQAELARKELMKKELADQGLVQESLKASGNEITKPAIQDSIPTKVVDIAQPDTTQDIIDTYENKEQLSASALEDAQPAQSFTENIFQNQEEIIQAEIQSEVESRTSNTQSSDIAQSSTSEQFIIQAGSFRSQLEADRQRGQLLLLGFQPSIEQANLDAEGTWFRVILGPFAARNDAEKVVSQIDQQKFPVRIFRKTTS
ncbi:MAG: SPOR domain-containing protein [Pseudomonadota bacterium]